MGTIEVLLIRIRTSCPQLLLTTAVIIYIMNKASGLCVLPWHTFVNSIASLIPLSIIFIRKFSNIFLLIYLYFLHLCLYRQLPFPCVIYCLLYSLLDSIVLNIAQALIQVLKLDATFYEKILNYPNSTDKMRRIMFLLNVEFGLQSLQNQILLNGACNFTCIRPWLFIMAY